MPTSRAVKTEVENLLSYLVDSEIALYARPVRSDYGRVSWIAFEADSDSILRRDPTASSSYRQWVEAGEYSAVLADGALLQLTYECEGHVLVGHRLAYAPCPFEVDPELLVTESILDVFDLYASGHASDVLLSTVVRFDFDPSGARPGHPAAHMTINSRHCRIACTAPLRVGQFIDFVFRNFYPEIWQLHPYLDDLPKSGWGRKTVTETEAERLHLSWRV